MDVFVCYNEYSLLLINLFININDKFKFWLVYCLIMSVTKRISQIIWFDPITFSNIMSVYAESGASRVMALNDFISKILDVIMFEPDMVKKVVENILNVYPEIKRYSFFVEKIEIEKPIPVKVFLCPYCFNEFKNMSELKNHFMNEHKKNES